MNTNGGIQFKKATKKSAKLRLALIGPAGSGKTYTALAVAAGLGKKVAVIDTERGSASKYADLFAFDVLELDSFHPRTYADAIGAAAAAGYDVVVVDSLSHAWIGKDGGLELHDNAVDRQKTKNTYTAWRDVTPHHNAMVESIVQARCHVIATMRAKTEYVQEKDERGKTTVRKVGLAPVQRDGLEYEFDVVGDLDNDNTLVIGKTRCPALAGIAFRKPGADLAKILAGWLTGGAADLGPAHINVLDAAAGRPATTHPGPPPVAAQPDAHFVAESAQLRAQFEHLIETAPGGDQLHAAIEGIRKFKAKLTADDTTALRNTCRAALGKVTAAAKSKPAASGETAPWDLILELNQLVRKVSRHRTWMATLPTYGITPPAGFIEPSDEGMLEAIGDWLLKADAERIRDSFKVGAQNAKAQADKVRQQPVTVPADDDQGGPEPDIGDAAE